jgi:hypothetical protein
MNSIVKFAGQNVLHPRRIRRLSWSDGLRTGMASDSDLAVSDIICLSYLEL